MILHGNLSPEGGVLKLSGTERARHRGPARVFDSEEAAFEAVQLQTIKPGDVMVIRYEGPGNGGPGMREMLAVTAYAIVGVFGLERFGSPLLDRRALLGRDARLHGRPCLARKPRCGGPIAADPRRRHDRARRGQSKPQRLDVQLDDGEMRAKRLASAGRRPRPRYETGVMAKYARMVSSASIGAITG